MERGSSINDEMSKEDQMDVRKGPWTAEEDSLLFNYIHSHGEGHWNSVARFTGLKRTGKSCRLRWLNYLRPSVRRGNITLQEQLMILELHFRWGNRWSKIAQFLPGRTDNEIKNYWRTRVQKQAKQLNCDVNSKQFRDAMRYVWIPRLQERIQAAASEFESKPNLDRPVYTTPPHHLSDQTCQIVGISPTPSSGSGILNPIHIAEIQATSSSSNVFQISSIMDLTESSNYSLTNSGNSPNGSGTTEQTPDIQDINGWLDGGDSLDSLWSEENLWFLQQQLCEEL